MLHSLGIAHQPPSFLIPLPALSVSGLRRGLQTSIQASAGAEIDLPEATTATVTVFENIFLNMSDTLGDLRPGEENLLRDERSQGSAHGLELYLRRRLTHKIGGFVSYTLSRTTRSVSSERFPGAFDRAHVLHAALAYDLGRRWRAGTRVTGVQRRAVFAFDQGSNSASAVRASAAGSRGYRIDLRLEKRWQLSKSTWLAFVAELMNTTLNTETVLAEEIGPVTIPSIGLWEVFHHEASPTTHERVCRVRGSASAQLSSRGHTTRAGQHLDHGVRQRGHSGRCHHRRRLGLAFDQVLLAIGPIQLGDDCTKYAEYSEPGYDRIVNLKVPGPQKVSIMYGLGRCDIDSTRAPLPKTPCSAPA